MGLPEVLCTVVHCQQSPAPNGNYCRRPLPGVSSIGPVIAAGFKGRVVPGPVQARGPADRETGVPGPRVKKGLFSAEQLCAVRAQFPGR